MSLKIYSLEKNCLEKDTFKFCLCFKKTSIIKIMQALE